MDMKTPHKISERIDSLCLTPACGIVKHRLLTLGDCQAQLAEKIGGVIAHRIDFPKVKAGKMGRTASLNAKLRPMLTMEEKGDVRQIVAFTLCATGALQRGKLTFGDWKECFRAVRGGNGLRIDRKAKGHSENVRIDLMTPEAIAIISVTENIPQLSEAKRKVIARRIRHLRACARAWCATDTSRQKKANRKKLLRVIRFLASQYMATGEGFSEIVDTEKDLPSVVSDCMAKFRKRIAEGDSILTAESMAGIESAPIRTLSRFADIPENFAIAD